MDISIQTAQNVGIAYKPAGLVDRITATLIDLTFLGGMFILCFILSSLSPVLRSTTAAIVLLVILLCYHFVCEFFFNGKSLGKLILHLKVVRLDGQRLTFWNCLLRWVLRLVDISGSIGTIAMVSIIISSKMQRLGDLAAGTIVIQEEKKADLARISRYDTPENYEVSFPQAAFLSDKDIAIIREVYEEFEKNKEYKLLKPLAEKIKTLTGIQTDINNLQFIQILLRDYTHLTK